MLCPRIGKVCPIQGNMIHIINYIIHYDHNEIITIKSKKNKDIQHRLSDNETVVYLYNNDYER